jgi:hypothetical protein
MRKNSDINSKEGVTTFYDTNETGKSVLYNAHTILTGVFVVR